MYFKAWLEAERYMIFVWANDDDDTSAETSQKCVVGFGMLADNIYNDVTTTTATSSSSYPLVCCGCMRFAVGRRRSSPLIAKEALDPSNLLSHRVQVLHNVFGKFVCSGLFSSQLDNFADKLKGRADF